MYRDKVVLDAGGGLGGLIYSLNGLRLKVLLDIDKSKLKKSKVVNRIAADIDHLPFISDLFDLATFVEVLEHLKHPQKTIVELGRTCKVVLITTPNNSLFRRLLWKIRGKKFSSPDHIREYSPREIKVFFKHAGFDLIKFKGIGFVVMNPKWIPFHVLELIPYFSSKVLMVFVRKYTQKKGRALETFPPVS